MVEKLLKQRKKLGHIRPLYDRVGGKLKLSEAQHHELRKLVSEQPDMTLEELRSALKADCTIPTIHNALKRMGLTYKKRHSEPVNKIERMLP